MCEKGTNIIDHLIPAEILEEANSSQELCFSEINTLVL